MYEYELSPIEYQFYSSIRNYRSQLFSAIAFGIKGLNIVLELWAHNKRIFPSVFETPSTNYYRNLLSHIIHSNQINPTKCDGPTILLYYYITTYLFNIFLKLE